MSSVMKFDKINALDSNRRSEPYKEYLHNFHRKEKNNGNCIKHSNF